MTKAFCPGHITCFFSPELTNDVLTSGSLGAGIRLDKGVTVTAEERRDIEIRITMDGAECNAPVSRRVAEIMVPGRGFDIIIENDLPVSQGFGMSAAGAVAAGLCISCITGAEEFNAYKAAHTAELENKSGMGDVAGIMGGRQPVRVKSGIPPFGRVTDTGIEMKVTVAVLGPPLRTGSVLNDSTTMHRIQKIGERCVRDYMDRPSEAYLYDLSSSFSENIGLETADVREALSLLRKNNRASMCMLGNSIFTDACADSVRKILGSDTEVIECVSCAEGPKIIRKV
jgi:pantoate kinase